MAQPENSTYRHRHNEGGTFDSICPHCYLTIASANKEQGLYVLERLHECDPVRLYELASSTWAVYLSSVA
jgi:hypothetical protein